MPLSPLVLSAAALALLLLAWGGVVLRRRAAQRQRQARRTQELDTIAAWPPESARVLTVSERQAYERLRRAMPGFMVLAQVPLARFVRVPLRNAYADWLQRVGHLSADLLLCDSGSKPLAVIDIRSPAETERSKRRHERLGRVLRAAGIQVLTWQEGALPDVTEVRRTVSAALGADRAAVEPPTPSRPMPLIPVPDIAEILADGDAADHSTDPVPSAFFDDLEPPVHAARH